MTQPFGTIQDNSGPKIGPQDLIGRPLIIWVNDYKKNVGTRNTQTTGKLADPVICDIVDLRPPMGGEPILYRNVWIFTGSLIKTFKGLVGKDPNLVMFQQTANNFGGRSYVITDLSGDPRAAELGGAWMAANTDFNRSEPPPDPEPWVPQQQPIQPQNQGWPQGSVPAQQWQGQPALQFQQPQYAPQQPTYQPQPAWGQQQQASHHEQGPPPPWAQQPVQQAPVPPAQPQYQQPPLPPQQQAQGVAPQSILERLAMQHQNNDAARQQSYNPQQEQQQYGY